VGVFQGPRSHQAAPPQSTPSGDRWLEWPATSHRTPRCLRATGQVTRTTTRTRGSAHAPQRAHTGRGAVGHNASTSASVCFVLAFVFVRTIVHGILKATLPHPNPPLPALRTGKVKTCRAAGRTGVVLHLGIVRMHGTATKQKEGGGGGGAHGSKTRQPQCRRCATRSQPSHKTPPTLHTYTRYNRT
jgi:hypothetical protein